MSDELAIQQQKQGSATPYALGGAVLGGVAGAFSPVGVTRPKYSSFEDILKESEDTFSKEIEKGGDNKGFWETAKSHVDKVKNAEKEYEEKVAQIKEQSKSAVGQLPEDNAAAKSLADAQKAYDDELARLVDIEKNRLSKGTGTEIDVKNLKKFKDLTTEQLPTEYAFGKKKGQKIPSGEIENLYKRLTDDLINAEKNLKTKLNNGLRKDKRNAMKDIKVNLIDKAIADTEALSGDDFIEYFEKGSKRKPSKSYQRALDVAEKYYADVTTLTPEQIESIGHELKPGESKPKRMKEYYITAKDPATGRSVTKTICYDPDVYDNLLESEREKVKNLRRELADQIFAESHNASTLNRELKALDVNFEQTLRNDMNQLTNTGLYNPTTDRLDLAKIKSEGGFIAGKKDSKYIDDIKLLENAKKARSSTLPTGLSGNYGSATIDEALKQAHARHNIFKQYCKQYNSIYEQMQKCAQNNTIVQNLDSKIAEAISNDKAVQDARTRLAEQFDRVYSVKPATLTADEIATKADDAAKAAIEKSGFKTRLETAKNAAAEEAKKLGLTAKELTDDELVKILKEKGLGSKEEYLAQLKKAAQEAVEKDLGKIKGPNKWVNAAIAAAALGLVGLGIGKAVNK